jgi:lipoprotein-releasing system ATP-binding protein
MLFKLNNISKHYGSESDASLRKVLDGLSLEIKGGESIAILGPSGSGKTTLLNIMGTLDRPDSGDVFFHDNKDVFSSDNKSVSGEIDLGMLDNNRSDRRKSGSVTHDEEVNSENLTGRIQERATTGIASTDNTTENSSDKTQTHSENISPADKKSELRAMGRPVVKVQPYNPKTKTPSSKENITGRTQFAPTPVTGHLFSQKENLINYSTRDLDTFRNQKIGFVFQMHHLLPQCTLLENILIPTLTIADKKIKVERLIRAKELMERVGIWEQRDQIPGHLSGGECQRAAVVRALINKPGLLLADEPTGALDEDNVSKLALLLLEINKTDGVTLVVVTHSLALAARMDTVYELKNGKLRLKNLKA